MPSISFPPDNWYKSWFNEYYIELYSHRDQKDAAPYIQLLKNFIPELDRQSVLLDIGSGQSRYLSLLKKSYPFSFGIDLSRILLNHGIQHFPGTRGLCCQGDMRQLPFSGKIDCALNMFTSFGYFLSEQENDQVMEQIAGALKKGGTFVLDHINKDWLIHNFSPRTCESLGEATVTQERSIKNNRINKTINWKFPNKSAVRFHESVQLYSPEAFTEIGRRFGFQLKHSFGSSTGEPLNPESERMILIFQKS